MEPPRFLEVQAWVLIVLSLLSMISFLMRAYFERLWVCVTKAVPRFLFLVTFIAFEMYYHNTPVPDYRGIMVRYAITYLLTTDLLYNGGVILKEIKELRARGDNV